MPNLSALSKIDDYIQSQRLKPMKKWSLRTRFDTADSRPRYLRKFIRQIRNIMILVSGDDIVEMLKDVLKKNEREELSLSKYKDALINLSETYEKAPLKQRHNIMRPLKKAFFQRSEVRRLGFKVSKHLWNTCDNTDDRKLGGGRSIPDDLQDAINKHLVENANKTLLNGSVNVSSNDSNEIIALYKSFPLKNQLARTTFYKYVKMSDSCKSRYLQKELCDQCEKMRTLNKSVNQDVNFVTTGHEYYQPVALIKDFESKLKELNEQISNVSIIELKEEKQNIYDKYEKILKNLKNNNDNLCFHTRFTRIQTEAYNNHKKNLNDVLKDKVMIKIDHKQNIFIDVNHKRPGIEYSNDQKILSCLGLIIHYIDSNNSVKVINFDIITSELKQHSKAAINGFRLLRKQEFFKDIDKRDYIVWCSKYIMSQSLIGYLFGELADEKIHVNLNFSYGKRSKSGHFVTINQFIEDELLVNKLDCSQDVVEAIFKQQKISSESRLQNRKPPTIYAIAVDLEDVNTNYGIDGHYIDIKNIENLYNLQTIGDNFEIVTSVLSSNIDLSVAVEIINRGRLSTMPENLTQIPQKKTRKRLPKKIVNNNNNNANNSAIKIRRVEAATSSEQNVSTNRNIENFFTENFAEELMASENQNANFTYNINTNNFNDNNNNNNNNNNSGNYMNCENYINFAYSNNIQNNQIKRPKYCNIVASAKKPQCLNCHAICNHSIESILDPVNPIGQKYVYEELAAHGHPKSRLIDNRQRKTREAARELADHYIYAHGYREPFFV